MALPILEGPIHEWGIVGVGIRIYLPNAGIAYSWLLSQVNKSTFDSWNLGSIFEIFPFLK